MDIHLRRQKFIEAIQRLNDVDILAHLESLLLSELRQSIQPMSKNELHARIQSSIKDSEDDNVISSSDLLNEIESWN